MKTVGLIGIGEVGSRYSSGMALNGASVYGNDLRLGTEALADNEETCKKAGVILTGDKKQLIEACDIILAPTTCADAITAAEQCAQFLTPGKIYIDMNSAVPTVKKKVGEIIAKSGATFLDGITLNSPLQFGAKTKVFISGPGAQNTVNDLNECGMNTHYLGEEIGQASILKILRSVFMKGSEALLIEALSTAERFGVTAQVFDLIADTPDRVIWERFETMVRAGVKHDVRRMHEIRDIRDFLGEQGMNNIMSIAATEKLRWAIDQGLYEKFGGKVPATLEEVCHAYNAYLDK